MIKLFVCLLLNAIDIFYFKKKNKTTLTFVLLGLVIYSLYFFEVEVSNIIYLIDIYVASLFLLNCYYLRKQKQKEFGTLTALMQLLIVIIMGIIIKFT